MVWKCVKITDISPAEYEKTYALLHPSRRAHIDRLKKEKDRLCSLAGEFLIKKILEEDFGVKCPIIKRDKKGKPITESGEFISISHCDQFVVCAAHTTPVGIDIERKRNISPALINRVCTENEQAYLTAAKDDAERLYRFFEIWTAKEAYFKKQGTGIIDFKSVNIFDLDRKIICIEDYVIQIVV